MCLQQIDNLTLRAFVFTLIPLVVILIVTRFQGLRSFSKMTSFDFVCTLAVGSLFASAAASKSWESFYRALAALSAVFLFQFVLSKLRCRFPSFKSAISNTPAMLFSNGDFNEESMSKCRVTKDDLLGKLREANAIELSSVHYIVLEATGDISVLHGGGKKSVSKELISF